MERKLRRPVHVLDLWGSWIVADVILNALAADEDSYCETETAGNHTDGAGPDAMGRLLGVVFPNRKTMSILDAGPSRRQTADGGVGITFRLHAPLPLRSTRLNG